MLEDQKKKSLKELFGSLSRDLLFFSSVPAGSISRAIRLDRTPPSTKSFASSESQYLCGVVSYVFLSIILQYLLSSCWNWIFLWIIEFLIIPIKCKYSQKTQNLFLNLEYLNS